jgi:tRNA uridine 5-carboxymethylaminomethyl modification enzyme
MEARQKLHEVQPRTIGQASRISGVNPTDIANLVMVLKKKKHEFSYT